MKQNYLISILGSQTIEENTDEVELICVGSYIKKGDKHYIIYDEYDNDSIKSKTTTVLKIEHNKVTLIRTGYKKSKLILEKEKRHVCNYGFGYGNILVGVYTSIIDCNLGDAGGSIYLKYSLDANSELLSLNKILIKIKENK